MEENKDVQETTTVSRRNFFSLSLMTAALVAAYGFFAGLVTRFLVPKDHAKKRRPMFVAFADKIPAGSSHVFYSPKGEQVILTNTGQLQAEEPHSFIAFSSRCPHLGCKVHFDGKEKQFICPCHQGLFNMQGVATAGPPAAAGQSLASFPVTLDGNSVYVMVEVS